MDKAWEHNCSPSPSSLSIGNVMKKKVNRIYNHTVSVAEIVMQHAHQLYGKLLSKLYSCKDHSISLKLDRSHIITFQKNSKGTF